MLYSLLKFWSIFNVHKVYIYIHIYANKHIYIHVYMEEEERRKILKGIIEKNWFLWSK